MRKTTLLVSVIIIIAMSLSGIAQQSPPKKRSPRLTMDDVPESQIVTIPPIGGKETPGKDAAPSTYQSEDWFIGAAGYEKALEEHRKTKAPLVVYFYTEWCGYCKRLDKELLPQPEMTNFLKKVIKIRINPEKGKSEYELSKQFKVDGFPSFFVMANENSPPVRVHPFISINGKPSTMSPSEFASNCSKAAGIG